MHVLHSLTFLLTVTDPVTVQVAMPLLQVLQPGIYETVLISEFCDQRTLGEAIAQGGKLRLPGGQGPDMVSDFGGIQCDFRGIQCDSPSFCLQHMHTASGDLQCQASVPLPPAKLPAHPALKLTSLQLVTAL